MEVLKHLKTKKDLERALPKLHHQATVDSVAVMFMFVDSNKHRVRGLVAVLRGLQDYLEAMDTLREVMDKPSPKSKRLRWVVLTRVRHLEGSSGQTELFSRDKLNCFLGETFVIRAAEVAGEMFPNRRTVPLYDECRDVLKSAESELSSQLIK